MVIAGAKEWEMIFAERKEKSEVADCELTCGSRSVLIVLFDAALCDHLGRGYPNYFGRDDYWLPIGSGRLAKQVRSNTRPPAP